MKKQYIIFITTLYLLGLNSLCISRPVVITSSSTLKGMALHMYDFFIIGKALYNKPKGLVSWYSWPGTMTSVWESRAAATKFAHTSPHKEAMSHKDGTLFVSGHYFDTRDEAIIFAKKCNRITKTNLSELHQSKK